jgi:hypothetical protein
MAASYEWYAWYQWVLFMSYVIYQWSVGGGTDGISRAEARTVGKLVVQGAPNLEVTVPK